MKAANGESETELPMRAENPSKEVTAIVRKEEIAANPGSLSIAAELIIPLRSQEKERLAECENVLRRSLKTAFDAADALLVIRNERLFRETHSSFAAYCHERWGIGRSYAWRLLGAAERLKLLSSDGGMPRPMNEFQIRPFLKLRPEVFPKLWEQTLKRAKDGKVTPALANKVINDWSPPQGGEAAKNRKGKRLQKQRALPIGQIDVLLSLAKQRIEKGEKDEALEYLERIEKLLFGP